VRAGAVKEGYEQGARRLAARSMTGLARTRVTPNALTATGVFLCCVSAVLVYFEYRNEILFFWVGAVAFLVGSVLDIMDGALARQSGRGTEFGAFIDSTTDRVGEAAMLGAIVLVLMRDGDEVGVALTVAALAGGMLVPYARARAEALGLKGEVGYGGRGERVAVIVAALVLAPWGLLPWGMGLLTIAAWSTVLQRILLVRAQLRAQGRLAAK
jgi:CDP-diacylglycerol---glycerol-3-phosphate 3-phosphatidyltransferase